MIARDLQNRVTMLEECNASLGKRCELTHKIIAQLYAALERLGADEELLSIVGSYGDTLDDSDVLRLLKDYNTTGKVIHTPQ